MHLNLNKNSIKYNIDNDIFLNLYNHKYSSYTAASFNLSAFCEFSELN